MARKVIKISAWKKQHPDHEPKALLLHACSEVSRIGGNGHVEWCSCDDCRIVRVKTSLKAVNKLMKELGKMSS